MKLRVERALVCHRPEWGKWPDTADMDYSDILSARSTQTYVEGDRQIEVVTREWPVFLSFAKSTCELPYRYPPNLDNSVWPSETVMEQQRHDLQALRADGVKILLWEHSYGCYPPVAKILRDTFPLTFLQFGDDAPGSSEVKTLPVAGAFNIYLHAMNLMSFETGERVKTRYLDAGVDKCCLVPSRTTVGLIEWCLKNGHTIERRVERIRGGGFDTDLVFVGALGGSVWRHSMLSVLDNVGASPRVALYGSGTRRGILQPRVPPGGDGGVVAPMYAKTLFGVNPQWSSIWNTRLSDLWYMGVPQFVYDPHKELEEEGFLPDEHYVAYDGTVANLLERVEEWKQDPERCVRLALAAHAKSVAYTAGKHSVLPQIYFDAWDRLL